MGPLLVHPTYWPSIAQMAYVIRANEVVFERWDNYQKQTYRNRAYIAHANGKLSLNVPVLHSVDGRRQTSREVRTDGRFPWAEQHWKSLQSAYRSSPYFEYYEDELIDLFSEMDVNLMDHNMRVFQRVCELLGTEINWRFSDSYQMEADEFYDKRNLVVAKKAPTYSLTPYTQVLQPHGEFLSNLSILDLLFNEGPNTLSYLMEQNLDI
ncbi:WbqC family protein [Aureitalea marina]|uniref:WbqC-like protein n=1 Tax=Aureitalea marina TaxID=930804 RepID=A0A2S7KQ02_9FLAO|nr:WbqC family protein [Aureitalea marina]PQB04691.1 hypothetical protein BST85_07130 [Aureitalea marina]